MGLLRRLDAKGAIGFAILILVLLTAVAAPWLAPIDPNAQDLSSPLLPPAWIADGAPGHLLGTDQLGEDVLSRIIYGARVSLSVGAIAVLGSGTLGSLLGLIAGYFAGWLGGAIMRLVDIVLAVPFILLALVFMTVFGPSLANLVLVLVLARWVQFTRIGYGLVLEVREREYIQACIVGGLSTRDILLRHVLINVAGPLLVVATLEIGFVILMEAGLSFLGLGTPPEIPSWGGMLQEGRTVINIAWWLTTFPGLAIMLTVIGFNFVGDWLRDRLDPRTNLGSSRIGTMVDFSPMTTPLLQVENLSVSFVHGKHSLRALDGLSFSVEQGRTLGIVGESGCGKSLMALAIMRLLPSPARQDGGRILLASANGSPRDIARLPSSGRAIRAVRGREIAMIFQEPMTALNPSYSIGEQIREGLRAHQGISRRDANRTALELLTMVGVPAPERRLRQYPHELSGGMRQRAMIAIALACGPALLIADEPTTALDVTIQAQVLALMRDMQARLGTAILFITHDMGVIAETADDVMVMYLGRIVETGPVAPVLEQPAHPYTRGLIASIPTLDMPLGRRLVPIPGMVPGLGDIPAGCRFNDRCPHVRPVCRREDPPLRTLPSGQQAACWFAGELP